MLSATTTAPSERRWGASYSWMMNVRERQQRNEQHGLDLDDVRATGHDARDGVAELEGDEDGV